MPDGSSSAHLYRPKLLTTIGESYRLADLQRDATAGLTVAVVALPLSMAIAVAFGVTPERGLFTAIVEVLSFPLSAAAGIR
jgi:sulfate permease, SulP family